MLYVILKILRDPSYAPTANFEHISLFSFFASANSNLLIMEQGVKYLCNS